MSKVFVINNQHGHFINKHKEWVDGREPKLLFRSVHKDEAINLVFELSSRDIYLRAEAISVDLDKNNQPIVEVTAEIIAVSDQDPAQTVDNGAEPNATETMPGSIETGSTDTAQTLAVH